MKRHHLDKAQAPISVMCVITAVGQGGAEAMLYRFLAHLDRTRFTAQVVSLTDYMVPFGDRIKELGIPVRSLGMRSGVPDVRAVLLLARWMRKDRPDVIQTWQYHADLIGGMAAKLAGGIPVSWGIQNSDLSAEGSKRMTVLTAKACAWASGWLPARVVCCSEVARRIHVDLGYQPEKMMVIPNACDLTAFRPDVEAREAVRRELDIPVGAPVIGLMARFDPQKDHRTFLQAAALLHRERPDVHFLLCGRNVTWENETLGRWIDEASVRSRCRLLGLRQDIPRLTAALDIATLSSAFGEAFPMVIGEAMGSAVPCVVTDVGDCAQIVGDTGLVVPPRHPEALAKAWRESVDLGSEQRARLGLDARQRMKDLFDINTITARYQDLLEDLTAVRAH